LQGKGRGTEGRRKGKEGEGEEELAPRC